MFVFVPNYLFWSSFNDVDFDVTASVDREAYDGVVKCWVSDLWQDQAEVEGSGMLEFIVVPSRGGVGLTQRNIWNVRDVWQNNILCGAIDSST